MKIFLCQTKPKVGDLKGNFEAIKQAYEDSVKSEADICLLPELSTSGYMAGDLLTQKGFLEDIASMVDKIVSFTTETCLLIPTPILSKTNLVYNSVIAAQNGKIIGHSSKQELPNYGVFDEKRYFAIGESNIISVNGIKIGVPICEDIWFPNVCNQLKKDGAQLFLVPNGSPYEKEKMSGRIEVVKQRYQETQIPIVFCNQVLGHDGIIFDGRSFCYDGELKIVGKDFETDRQLIEFSNGKFKPERSYSLQLSQYEEILKALILGLSDYVHGNNFKKIVLGLSGGIDSALVAVIAREALGPENVTAYMLPSKFTSENSKEDAEKLAAKLDIKLESIDISQAYNLFLNILSISPLAESNSITCQNIQSRIRGTILMTKANESNALLITTGNKSEYATGYATIYGDMNGAFNPIKDLYKTEIYALASYINQKMNIIPNQIITKEPSAELSYNQKDSDSLPDYPVLDEILTDHIEHNLNYYNLSKKHDPQLAQRIVQLVKNSEFKRKQAAPGVKISQVNFEKDRRFPITNYYK
jgi:NAD+ synthase